MNRVGGRDDCWKTKSRLDWRGGWRGKNIQLNIWRRSSSGSSSHGDGFLDEAMAHGDEQDGGKRG